MKDSRDQVSGFRDQALPPATNLEQVACHVSDFRFRRKDGNSPWVDVLESGRL
jgi:hypothetical protein